jgi:hypothetical protein
LASAPFEILQNINLPAIRHTDGAFYGAWDNACTPHHIHPAEGDLNDKHDF